MTGFSRRRYMVNGSAPQIDIGGGAPGPAFLSLAPLSRQIPDVSRCASIRALSAGDSFVDPHSGLRWRKLSDRTFPTANSDVSHLYSEGGPYTSKVISNGNTVLCWADFGSAYLIDVARGVSGGVSNARVPAILPFTDICAGFSHSDATPNRLWVLNSTSLYALDTVTNTIEDLPFVPSTGKDFTSLMGGDVYLQWLTVTDDDAWIIFQSVSSGDASKLFAFSPSTGVTKTQTWRILDQLHPARSGRLVIGLSRTITPLADVRIAVSSNVTIASPGATLDSISMVAGDRVLLFSQSTTSQNGVYQWNGAATPMTRTTDTDTALELESISVAVTSGSSSGLAYRQTSINFTLDTDPVLWETQTRNSATGMWDYEAETFRSVQSYGGHVAALRDGYAETDADYGFNNLLFNEVTDTPASTGTYTDVNTWVGQHKAAHHSNGTTLYDQWFMTQNDDGFNGITTSAWTLVSGQKYSATVSFPWAFAGQASMPIIACFQGPAGTGYPTEWEQTLAQAASVGAMVEGSIHYDGVDTVTVWAFGGGTPQSRVELFTPFGNFLGLALCLPDTSDGRLLGHHMSRGTSYYDLPFGSWSADGLTALVVSNMGIQRAEGGHMDLYQVEITGSS